MSLSNQQLDNNKCRYIYTNIVTVEISVLMLSCLQTHRLISPRLYHARHKREIADTRDTSAEGRHVHHLTVAWDLDGEDFVLDLNLNRELIPEKYFEKYHHQVSTDRCTANCSYLCGFASFGGIFVWIR